MRAVLYFVVFCGLAYGAFYLYAYREHRAVSRATIDLLADGTKAGPEPPALRERRTDLFMEYFAREARVELMAGRDPLVGPAQIRRFVMDMRTQARGILLGADNIDVTIAVPGERAVARFNAKARFFFADAPQEVYQGEIEITWTRRDGRWRVLLLDATPLPRNG